MSSTEDPKQSPSSDIVRLIRAVEQLSASDQERILKIVHLLTRVPASVQRTTQRMLKDLIDTRPGTIIECIAGVDEVIEYLENQALIHSGAADVFDTFDYVPGSRWPS